MAAAVQLDYVLAHELGHSLGVAHSLDRKALMFPSVQSRAVGESLLSSDDIRILQLLYGEGYSSP